MEPFLVILGFAGGYVASIYTWPWIRTTVLGVEAEIGILRTRLNSLITGLKSL